MQRKEFKIILTIFLPMLTFCTISISAEKDGVKIFQSAIEKWGKIQDYKGSFTYIEVEKGKESKGDYLVSFMKDDFRRMEGIEGDNKGTIVVYNPDENKDRVRVKKGFLPLTLSKDDERLSGFFDFDWGKDLFYLKPYFKNGTIKFIKKEKISRRDTNVLEFIPAKKSGYSKKIVWFDVKEKIPIQIEEYKEDKFYSRKTYKEFSINVGLKSEDFKF